MNRVRCLGSLGVASLLLGACTTTPGPTPSQTSLPPTPTPTATIAPSPTAPPTAAVPGSIVVLACPGSVTAGAVCFGTDTGTITARAVKGSKLTVTLVVNNPGGTVSPPVSVLLYMPDAGALPFGQPNCTTCNSTSGKSVLGLEWPALASGETRTVSVDIPVTGAAGATAFFANLYQQALADVMAAEIAGGIQPTDTTWKVALMISAK
ncbi:MAG TPA: hypothetical protein VE011_01235 [Candidatus Dormibacteraeota bacterium]|nr:hypothetical protein [Candidatus Dormibacteraeota bacterium]